MPQNKITRDDLEARFRALQEDVQHKVEDRRQSLTTIALVGGALLIAVIYLLGRRAGRKRTTFVEIRRL